MMEPEQRDLAAVDSRLRQTLLTAETEQAVCSDQDFLFSPLLSLHQLIVDIIHSFFLCIAYLLRFFS